MPFLFFFRILLTKIQIFLNFLFQGRGKICDSLQGHTYCKDFFIITIIIIWWKYRNLWEQAVDSQFFTREMKLSDLLI